MSGELLPGGDGVAVGDRAEVVGALHDSIDRECVLRLDGHEGTVARTWWNGNRRMARLDFGGGVSCPVRVGALKKRKAGR